VSVTQEDAAVLVRGREVGVAVPVDVARRHVAVGVAAGQGIGLRPGPVAVVPIDAHAVAATEGQADEVEKAVVVEVGEVRRPHAPVLAVGGQAVVPGGPARAGAVPQRDLDELVPEVRARVVVVHAVAHIQEPVVVHVSGRDPSVAERSLLMDRPAPGAICEVDHDAVRLRADVGVPVIADADEIDVAVAVQIRELELAVAAVPLRELRSARRRVHVGECGGGSGEKTEEHQG